MSAIWPANLQKGNERRVARSRRRLEIRELPYPVGMQALAAVVAEPPEECASLRVDKLKGWVHRFGSTRLQETVARANRALMRTNGRPIAGIQTIGTLTPRQREALVNALLEVGQTSVHARLPEGATETKRAS